MVEIAHGPHDELRAVQNTLLTVASSVSGPEGAVRVVKVQVCHGLPDIVHLVGRQGNLDLSYVYLKKEEPIHRIKNSPCSDTTT